MSVESESHKKDMQEAIRLYLWYSGSPHSFFKGKTSKVEAERQLYLVHFHNEELVKSNR